MTACGRIEMVEMINKISYGITVGGLFLTALFTFILTAGFGGKGYRRALDRWHFKTVVEIEREIGNS